MKASCQLAEGVGLPVHVAISFDLRASAKADDGRPPPSAHVRSSLATSPGQSGGWHFIGTR